MSDLYAEKELEALSTTIKDGTHGTHIRTREGVPFLSAKNISSSGSIDYDESDDRISNREFDTIHRVFRLEPGDLLLTVVGSLGRRAIYRGEKVTFQRSVAYIRPDQSKISSEFLFHATGRAEFGDQLQRRCNATAQAGIYLGELGKIKVPAPPPAHQSKIAEILDTLDAAIRGTEVVVGKLRAMKQGLLSDLLTRGIDQNGDLRPSPTEAPHLYHKTPLGLLPKGWEVELLDNAAQRGSGHTPSKSSPSYWNGGIKWVSLADSHRLDNIFIRETDKEISEAGLANSSAVLHPENTVILSRDAGIGKSAILASTMAVSQHFMAWRCGPRLNHVFLYYVLQSEKPMFEAIAMGSTIKTIGLPFFRRYQIALPPRHEQDRAAEVLLEAESQIAVQNNELSKLRAMKAGLMEDLLTGRVSVAALVEA